MGICSCKTIIETVDGGGGGVECWYSEPTDT